jgi:hypothetical protein
MACYFSRPKAQRPRADWLDDERPLVPNIDVPEHVEAFTGLLDSHGEEIWRAPRPVGFGRDREW